MRSAAVNYADIEAGKSWLGLAKPSEPSVITYDTLSANVIDLVFFSGSAGVSTVGLGPIGAGSLGAAGEYSGANNSAVLLSAAPGTRGHTYGTGTVSTPAYVTPTGEISFSNTAAYLPLGIVPATACYSLPKTVLGMACTVCTEAVGSAAGAVVDQSPTLSRCLRAVESRRQLLSERQIEALERQLRALLSDERELAEAGLSVSIASLHGLIDFLSSHGDKLHPNLSITRDGYFAASWSPRRRAKLTLTFKGGGVSEWVGVDLEKTPPTSGRGALDQIPAQFTSWMVAA